MTCLALLRWEPLLSAAQPPTYYVDIANPTPVPPYTSWETAATNIQQAIDAGTEPGRLVLVTKGVYRTGSVATNGLTRVAVPTGVTVLSVNGPEATVIEGAPAPGGGNGAGAIRCAYLGTNAVLSGFTLTNGHTVACCMGDSKQWSGGGALGESLSVLTNCVITGNSAGYGGGALGPTIYDCTVTANSATYGGGASRSTLYNCVVSRNSAIVAGGGAADASSFHNCTLTGNSAGEIGGGVSDSTLRNCTLTANSAQATGGGAYGGTLYNCTLSGNSAGRLGGGAVGGALYNCLVYFNTAEKGANYAVTTDFPSLTLEYCCTTPLPDGVGNIDADPRLASATHLSPDSPCVAAGSKAYAAGTDIDGEPWADSPCIGADQIVPDHALGPLTMQIEANYTNVGIGYPIRFLALSQGPIVASVWDFGDGTVVTNRAFVRHAWTTPGTHTVRLTGYKDSEPTGVTVTLDVQVVDATYYVNIANPSPVVPYTSWATAATNIQQAIDAGALPGRLVLVTNGVYRTERVETNGLNRVVLWGPILVRSVNGPESTIIEGSRMDPENGEGEDVRCAHVGPNSVLRGFTLTQGYGGWYDGSTWLGGGGALCATSGVLTNCVLTSNQASDGGGVYGGTLYNCTLSGNSAGSGGGAQSSTLYNCTLSDNSSSGSGGGAKDSTLDNCKVSHNSAGIGGGVSACTLHACFLTHNSSTGAPMLSPEGGGAYQSTLHNCVLMGNSSSGRGGGASGGTLYNCTLTGNSSKGNGGGASGIYNMPPIGWGWWNPAMLYNCVVFFNQAPEDPNWFHCAFEYSCTTPLPNGPGNLDADPQLLTLSHLAPTSPCIGAGSAAYATGTDIDGEPWGDPPCIGPDQVAPGPAVGALTMRIEATYTNLAPGFVASFLADNRGPIVSSVWDFGDGTAVTNQAIAHHAWRAPGSYTVRLTGYNDSNPGGVSATLEIHVEEVVHYVHAANPTPEFPYRSWATAATNIQQAIDAGTVAGRLVLVTNGVYRAGSAEANGWNRVALSRVLLQSVNGPAETIIEGGDYTDPDTGLWRQLRCAYVGESAVLSGFTLTEGTEGASCASLGMLTNCILAANSGLGVSGGTLYHCTLTSNAGDGANQCVLDHCTLANNAGRGAVGVIDENQNPSGCTLYNCALTGNTGCGAQDCILYNCELTDNRDGGASGSFLYNCTLAGNSNTYGGGGASWSTLYNCIVWLNSAPHDPNHASCTLEHSCTTPLPPGPGNLDADPRFVNAAGGNFHLRPDSPCIDAGTNLVDLITTDIEGRPRPLDGNGDGVARFDMGAYEFDPGSWFSLNVALTPTGLRLEWPATALGAKLQRTPNLASQVWQEVPGSEAVTAVTVPLVNATEFFRLMRP